jgi:hypothetical protein
MNSPNDQKIIVSAWQVAKNLWLAQILANLSFGVPLVAMTLFAANLPSFVIQQTVLFYLMISLCIFIPFHGILSFVFLKLIRGVLDKDHKERRAMTKEELRAAERLFNSPLYLSMAIFITSFSGFVFGLFILWSGLIPDLMPLIGIITALGLAIGFVACLIQAALIYTFLESHFRPQTELLSRLYPGLIKKIKIRKFPIFWKVFLMALSSVVVAQVSLGTLYLGRVAIYTPEDLKSALVYVGVVAASTLFYVVIIAILSAKNLVDPIKRIISWSDKVIKGKTKEEVFLATNDEAAELVEYLKKMYRALEEIKASLEIKIKARTRELEELTERQEETILKRTEEIQKRVEELERFRRLSVGRELKMVELKKEIKKLKGLLKQEKK